MAFETRLNKTTLITTVGRLGFTGSGKFSDEMLLLLFWSKPKGLAKRGDMSRNCLHIARKHEMQKLFLKRHPRRYWESNREKYYYY